MPAMFPVSLGGTTPCPPRCRSGPPTPSSSEQPVALRGTVAYARDRYTDISNRDIGMRYRLDTHKPYPPGGCRGPEPDCRPLVRRPWAAAPNAHAWLRAQQAAQHGARYVPCAFLRHPVPLPDEAVRRGP